jgi:hypothetical protein
LIFLDVILNERGYERSTSQPTLYTRLMSSYKIVHYSDKPISTCLLDQVKNDVKFSDKTPETINQVFETLCTFEAMVKINSTITDETQFLKKASNILQRRINIVDLKEGEKSFKLKSATKVQSEPYHLCFVQPSGHVYFRCWLSITPKKVQNTQTSSFSRISSFFQK